MSWGTCIVVEVSLSSHNRLIFTMNVAELFVDCLVAHGVTYVFGVPGEENLDLVEALRKSSIELIVTRHEQVAVFMAATYGRLT